MAGSLIVCKSCSPGIYGGSFKDRQEKIKRIEAFFFEHCYQTPPNDAMAVAVLTAHGDPDVFRLLPATLDPNQVALVGLHSWTEDDFPNLGRWEIRSFRPDDLHLSSQPLLDWLKASGCSRVAIHFDVDVVDTDQI
jgi:arginase family enzyme